MSKEKKDMVAVMLPRNCVRHWAQEAVDSRLRDGCKRALRPKPPTIEELTWMIGGYGRGTANRAAYLRIKDWIEYVLEHGWEKDND